MAGSEDVQGFCCSSLWWMPVRVHYIGCTLWMPASAQLVGLLTWFLHRQRAVTRIFNGKFLKPPVCMAGESRCCVFFFFSSPYCTCPREAGRLLPSGVSPLRTGAVSSCKDSTPDSPQIFAVNVSVRSESLSGFVLKGKHSSRNQVQPRNLI